jgi:hypothetical protein
MAVMFFAMMLLLDDMPLSSSATVTPYPPLGVFLSHEEINPLGSVGSMIHWRCRADNNVVALFVVSSEEEEEG